MYIFSIELFSLTLFLRNVIKKYFMFNVFQAEFLNFTSFKIVYI